MKKEDVKKVMLEGHDKAAKAGSPCCTPADFCCANGECCSSSATNEKRQNAGKGKWWKITALAVGVLLIVVATGYSLIIRHGGDAQNASLAQGAAASVTANTDSAFTRMGLGELTWVRKGNTLLDTNNFVFIILPKDDDSAKSVTRQVTGAIEKIREQGQRVSSMVLNPSDPEFTTTTQALGISQPPAVLILAKNGNGAIVTGNFDETKLLEAYLVVSNPICPPGSSSSCCPK